MKTKLFAVLALTCLSTLNPRLSTLFAQGTAFTYQGRLNDSGSPASGSYDLTFAVFDADSSGSQEGDTLTNSAVAVSNGLFTVTLDFGVGIFTGEPRWLEIGVATNGGGSFATLTPRQALLPSPYAIYAGTSASVASGSVVASLNGLKDDVTLAAGNNVTLTPNGNTVTIDAANGGGSSIWSQLNGNAYYIGGNVGIGTNSPSPGVRLEVNGTTRMNPGGSGGFVSIGTPGGETGIGIIGNNRADIRFDGSTLKLLAGVGPGAMSSQNGIAVATNGNVGVGTTTPYSKLSVAGSMSVDGSMLVQGDTEILGGHIALNSYISGDTTIEVMMFPGDVYPLRLVDSVGNSVFNVQYNPNFLSMYGDARKTSGGTSWSAFSDLRLKQDVRAYEPGLKEVLQLRPVRFRYLDDPKRGLTSNHEEVGFIAQEVREIIPEAVTEGKDGYLSLKADPIHWAAINAIQELNAKLVEQRAELKQKEAGMAELREKNDSLEKRLEALEHIVLAQKQD